MTLMMEFESHEGSVGEKLPTLDVRASAHSERNPILELPETGT